MGHSDRWRARTAVAVATMPLPGLPPLRISAPSGHRHHLQVVDDRSVVTVPASVRVMAGAVITVVQPHQVVVRDSPVILETKNMSLTRCRTPVTPPSTPENFSLDVLTRVSSTDSLEKRSTARELVEQLLTDIYKMGPNSRRTSSCTFESSARDSSDDDGLRFWSRNRLTDLNVLQLRLLVRAMRAAVATRGSRLGKHLRQRDRLRSRRDQQQDVITAHLQALSSKTWEDTQIRFSVFPLPGDSGFQQWHSAMKMVARLPGGIPTEFRRTLWLALADKHLQQRGVDWPEAEKLCFSEWSTPDDEDLGVQIVKDLHRTGCSMFCGQSNQAVLKRVLLAYARWNKAVGYCQGFNMLAALILQVVDRCERDAVKVMIFLIEGVLPESYFANNLRGLSVDMAVFRDLLRLRLQHLSRHLEQLQADARDSSTGTIYEPPLTNVFTMQWFLTLFCNCLPQPTVLRVWDLIFLEGNEILLRTALAIWDTLADRIMTVRSADEFYSIMGVLTREILEFGLMDPNHLIKTVVSLSCPELPALRDKHLYNISPWTATVSSAATSAARRGLRLFYAEGDSDRDESEDEDNEQIAVATAFGISSVFRSPKRRGSTSSTPMGSVVTLGQTDREKIALDISVLKQQYQRLRERQRQAQIILSAQLAHLANVPVMDHAQSNSRTNSDLPRRHRPARWSLLGGVGASGPRLFNSGGLLRLRGTACSGPSPLGSSVGTTSTAMNHLLVGKSALRSNKGRRLGPPPGAVPPPTRRSRPKASSVPPQPPPATVPDVGETLLWKDATKKDKLLKNPKDKKGLGGLDNVDDDGSKSERSDVEDVPPEAEDVEGADSDASSTSTELCDDPGAASDLDVEELAPSGGDAVLIHVEECRSGDDATDNPPGASALSPTVSPSPAVSPASPSVERSSTDEKSTFSEISASLSADTSLKLSPIPSDSVSDSTFKNEEWLMDVEISITSGNSLTLVSNLEEENSTVERTPDLVSKDLIQVDGDLGGLDSSFMEPETTVEPGDLSILNPVVKGYGEVSVMAVKYSDGILSFDGDSKNSDHSDSLSKIGDHDSRMLTHANRVVSSGGDVVGTGLAELSDSVGKCDGDLNRFGSLECSESIFNSAGDLNGLDSIHSATVVKGNGYNLVSNKQDLDLSRASPCDQRDAIVDNVVDRSRDSSLFDLSDSRIKVTDDLAKLESVDQSGSVKAESESGNVAMLRHPESGINPSFEEKTISNRTDDLISFGLFKLLDPKVNLNDDITSLSSNEKSDSKVIEESELNISNVRKHSGSVFKHVNDFTSLGSNHTDKHIDDFQSTRSHATCKTSDNFVGLSFGEISEPNKPDRDLFSILGQSSLLKSEIGKASFQPESFVSSLSRGNSRDKSDLKSVPFWSSVSKESQETDGSTVEATSSNVGDSGYSSVSTKDDSESTKKHREDVNLLSGSGSVMESFIPTSKPSDDQDLLKRLGGDTPTSRGVSDEEMTRREDEHPELKMWRPPVDKDRDCLSDASSYISPVRVPSSTSSVIDSDECRGADWSRMSSRETYTSSERGLTRQMSEYKDVSPGPEDDFSDSSKPNRRNIPLQSSLTQESDEFNLSSDTGSSKDSRDRPAARLFRREESTRSNDDKMLIREESLVSNEEDSLRSSALDIGDFGDEAKSDDFAAFDDKNTNLCQGERAKSAAGDVEGVTSSSNPKRERLGRQNSESVMKVIKENTAVLQRIQSWQREGRNSTSDDESQDKRQSTILEAASQRQSSLTAESKESSTADVELLAKKPYPSVTTFPKQESLTSIERSEAEAPIEEKPQEESRRPPLKSFSSSTESSTIEEETEERTHPAEISFSKQFSMPSTQANDVPAVDAEFPEKRRYSSVTLSPNHRSLSETESTVTAKETSINREYSSEILINKQHSEVTMVEDVPEKATYPPASSLSKQFSLPLSEPKTTLIRRASVLDEPRPWLPSDTNITAPLLGSTEKLQSILDQAFSSLEASLSTRRPSDLKSDKAHARYKFPEMSPVITSPLQPVSSLAKGAFDDSAMSTEKVRWKPSSEITPPSTPVPSSTEERSKKSVDCLSTLSDSLSKFPSDDDVASWKPSSLDKKKSKVVPSNRNGDESRSVPLEPTTLSVQMPLFREEKPSGCYEWQRRSPSPDEDCIKTPPEATGKSPLKFNPFPARPAVRQPKDLGVKLGLYRSASGDKSPMGKK